VPRPPDRTIKLEEKPGAFAVSPSGEEIVAASRDGTIQVFSISGEKRRAFRSDGYGNRKGPIHRWIQLAFSGDGRLMAGVRGRQHVAVLDAGDGRELFAFQAHEDVINALALSRDGSLLATAGNDGTIVLWKSADGSRVLSFAGSFGEGASIALSPEGDRIAGGWTDADVRIVSISGREVCAVADLSMAAFALAFSPDSRLLACGCADGVVSITDAATGERRGRPALHPTPVGFVAFSQDSRFLASVGLSMNPGTREAEVRVGRVDGSAGFVESIGVSHWNVLAFTSDGTAHVVDVEGPNLRIWDVRGPTPESRA
jgi:WD40 repeat protein